MIWKIKITTEKENCPHIDGISFCGLLTDRQRGVAVKCQECQCPLRVADNEEEAQKMVAGSE